MLSLHLAIWDPRMGVWRHTLRCTSSSSGDQGMIERGGGLCG